MTTGKTTPNFFILLGLNPYDPWDEKKFEQALREKRNEWSRQGASIGAKALQAKKNLEMVKDIQRVMTDPAARARQTTEAKTELQSQRHARMSIFQRQLELAQAKGYIEEPELARLIKDFADVLSEKEVRGKVGVEVRKPAPPPTKAAQKLDASTLNSINEKLKTINKKNLYELLDRAVTTSTGELTKAAQALYEDMVRRQPKTAEVTAKADLSGDARNIFSSEEKRKAYDESLRQSTLDSLLKELDETIGRTTEKLLHSEQARIFLERATQAGWKTEIAFARLRQHVIDRKWIMIEAPLDEIAQKQVCGNCGEINEKGRNYCRKCGEELNITCPDCGRPVPTLEVVCGYCGFPVGDRYTVDSVLAACEAALNRGDLKGLQQYVQQAEELWRPKKPDERAQKISNYKAQLDKILAQQRREIEEFDRYMANKQFFAAQKFLQAHPEMSGDRTEYQRRINEGITEAKRRFARARTPGVSNEAKAQFCREALKACSDYRDAQELLSKIPPSPPTALLAEKDEASVRLSWKVSRRPDVKYKIVRKSGSAPTSLKDGTLLATVSAQTYEDKKPEYNVPIYYAVFADDNGVISTAGATHGDALMLMQPVTNIKVEVVGDLLKLSWQVPVNAHSVLVVRKEGAPPTSRTDGVRIPTQSPTFLVDRGGVNGTYFYGIYCMYKEDADGSMLTAPVKVVNSTFRGIVE